MDVTLPDNRCLGSIFNNDLNNICYSMDRKTATPEAYRKAVNAILDCRPGLFAQNVGLPESVIYPTAVDTPFHTYLVEVSKLTWPKDDVATMQNECDVAERLFARGADPLSLTIGCCRDRGIPIVASYRMNAEDAYQNTYLLSDFGRAHPEWRIRASDSATGVLVSGQTDEKPEDLAYTGALDPAVPEVFEHRMAIFREVVERYDVDGIELDFRRWTNMVSRPLENHGVLTRMVLRIRAMLDEVAAKKGRGRMLLGARVGPSVDDPPGTRYPGGSDRNDISCRMLGLDVRAWVERGAVDYLAPALFWPRWPGLPRTAEFATLCRGKRTGVYPTLFPLPLWLNEGPDKGPIEAGRNARALRYRDELADLALQLYADGADGISTFNWYFHLRKARISSTLSDGNYGYGVGGDALQARLLSLLGDRRALKACRDDPDDLPTERDFYGEA